MAHEIKQIRVSSNDGIELDVIIDGETHEVRPGIVEILRVEAILDELGIEKGVPFTKQQMPPLVDAMIEHIGVPHTAQIRALGPKAQMRVATELLRIFNDVIGDPQPAPEEGTSRSSDPMRAELPEPSESPEEPVSRFSTSSAGATSGSERSSEG